jgi:RES domain-containing protein
MASRYRGALRAFRIADRRHTAVLVVPSVVSRHERNALINQDHPGFPLITASRPEPVIWDERLFRHRSSIPR